MKFNKIRPLLLLAFVIGSFPLQSADYVPEAKFTSVTATKAAPCSSDDHDDSGEGDGKATRSIASTSCL